MGYYASGDGYISFARHLKEDEIERIYELLSREFEDACFNDEESVSFWASEKYHGDTVEDILNEIARDYPVKEGCLQYSGEDGSHWRFRYDHSRLDTESGSPWAEEEGEVIFEGDREAVLILDHNWDTQFNEGREIFVFSPDGIANARAKMRAMAEEVRQKWREIYGADPWEEDYTWEKNDSIHLGFLANGQTPMLNYYSWEICQKEVIR